MGKRICGIYKITSPTGKIYIGKSVNIQYRFYIYKTLRCKSQPRLYNSLKKHKPEKHKDEIIQECEKDILNVLEIYYIKHFNTFNTEGGLNLKQGGEGGEFTEETKRKISIANKGVKLSLEHRKKLSESKKGKPTWNKGKKSSLETKLKISNSKKGKSTSSKGVPLSVERKTQLSLARRNSPYQHKKKIFCITNNKTYESIQDASNDLNIFHSNISRVCRKKQNNAKGFIFNYL